MPKQPVRNLCHSLFKSDISQIAAIFKWSAAVCQAFRYLYCSQRSTIAKCPCTHCLHILRQSHLWQICTIVKCLIFYLRHTVWYIDLCQLRAIFKRFAPYFCNRIGNPDSWQLTAIIKCSILNYCNRVRYCNLLYSITMPKQPVRNLCHSLFKSDISQIAAIFKWSAAVCQAFRYLYCSQRSTIAKCPCTHCLHILRQSHLWQICTIVKCLISYLRHTIRHHHNPQLLIILKHRVPNPHHRIPIQRLRYTQRWHISLITCNRSPVRIIQAILKNRIRLSICPGSFTYTIVSILRVHGCIISPSFSCRSINSSPGTLWHCHAVFVMERYTDRTVFLIINRIILFPRLDRAQLYLCISSGRSKEPCILMSTSRRFLSITIGNRIQHIFCPEFCIEFSLHNVTGVHS